MIKNDPLQDYVFLAEIAQDSYFPQDLVDKGRQILIGLCEEIEREAFLNEETLLELCQRATEAFNLLAEEFEARDSEIETAARECIAGDFEAIATAYGFDTDVEELIALREW